MSESEWVRYRGRRWKGEIMKRVLYATGYATNRQTPKTDPQKRNASSNLAHTLFLCQIIIKFPLRTYTHTHARIAGAAIIMRFRNQRAASVSRRRWRNEAINHQKYTHGWYRAGRSMKYERVAWSGTCSTSDARQHDSTKTVRHPLTFVRDWDGERRTERNTKKKTNSKLQLPTALCCHRLRLVCDNSLQ